MLNGTQGDIIILRYKTQNRNRMAKKVFFITHLIVDELPTNGLNKLYFYTATAESLNQGKYYWGTDNNSFNEEYMSKLEASGRIIKLPKPIQLDPQKSLWVDTKGIVFYADNVNPYQKEGMEIVYCHENI